MERIGVLIIAILTSCSQDIEKMDEWETQMADKLKAERIEIYHRKTTSTTNGRFSGEENYVQLDIYNSQSVTDIEFNQRLFSKKCDEIKDDILKAPNLTYFPQFDELRLNFIKTRGFLIFNSKTSSTITYRVH